MILWCRTYSPAIFALEWIKVFAFTSRSFRLKWFCSMSNISRNKEGTLILLFWSSLVTFEPLIFKQSGHSNQLCKSWFFAHFDDFSNHLNCRRMEAIQHQMDQNTQSHIDNYWHHMAAWIVSIYHVYSYGSYKTITLK